MHAWLRVRVHVRVYVCVQACVSVRAYVCACMRACVVCVLTCVHVCMRVYEHACVHVCVCVCDAFVMLLCCCFWQGNHECLKESQNAKATVTGIIDGTGSLGEECERGSGWMV